MLKLPSIQFLISNAAFAAKRFPFVLLSAIACNVTLIVYSVLDIDFFKHQLIYTISIAIPWFFTITYFCESKGRLKFKQQLLFQLAGLAAMVLHYFVNKNDGTANYVLRYVQLNLAVHLLVSFAPFIKRGSLNGFWQFNKYLLLRMASSFVHAWILYAGLAIALITIDKLFNVDIKGKYYTYLLWISMFTFLTWHFLAGMPKNIEALDDDQSYPRSLKLLVQYLLIPMVSLYMVILYTYMGKIIITGVWPEGYVGWLVSIMSVLGILNLLLIDPEKSKSENRWVVTYSRFFYFLIIPLLIMLFIAIGKRIGAYGITENRYFLLILGSLLLGLSIYFVISKKKSIKTIPITLFILCLVTAWGPFSAYNVSLRSQLSRAEDLLRKNQLLLAGKIQKSKSSVSYEDQKQLSSVFDYVIQKHGSEHLDRWFPLEVIDSLAKDPYGSMKFAARRQTSENLMKRLGLSYYTRWDNQQNIFINLNSKIQSESVNISQFDHLVKFNGYNRKKEFLIDEVKYSYEVDKENAQIRVESGGESIAVFDLNSLLKNTVIGRNNQKIEKVSPNKLIFSGPNGSVQFSMMIDSLNGSEKNGRLEISSIYGYFLVEKSDNP